MRKLKKKIKSVLAFINNRIFQLALKTRLTALLYGHLVCRDFDQEIFAFMQGKRQYEVEAEGSASSIALLRRNTHRLEKGLIMQPKRPMFAESYIVETVESCLKHSNNCNSSETVKWAQDVLSMYFNTVTLPSKFTYLEENFRAVVPCVEKSSASVPYARSDCPTLKVGYDDFFQLSLRRRSIRWYENKSIPRDLIDKAVDAARYSPSACNRQPFEFFVIDNPDRAKEIGDIPMGTTGFSSNFPAFIIVVGNLNNYPYARDRHLIYVDGALASMSLMLALETLGLASCPINWPDIDALDRKMAKELMLKPYQRPIMCISLGYARASGGVPFSSKKPVSEIRRYVN